MITRFYNKVYGIMGLQIVNPTRFFTAIGVCTVYGAYIGYLQAKSYAQ